MYRPDFFNKTIAEKLGERLKKELPDHNPLSIVKQVNRYYWRKGVRKNLSEANYTAIFIKNLGTIAVSQKKLRKHIFEVIEGIRKVRNSKWITPEKKIIIEERLINNLKKLLVRRNELALLYYVQPNQRICKTNPEGDNEL